MQENDIKLLWQSTQLELEKSIRINHANTESITRLKVDNLLSSMKPTKMVLLGLGVLWVGLVGSFVVYQLITAYNYFSPYFLFSLALQVMLTAASIIIYMYQLGLIRKTDFSQPVVSIQKKLTRLQFSTLLANRILFLQLPLWTTFYLSENMLSTFTTYQWLLQGTMTILFAGLAIWLFMNIRYENRNKKWFRILFNNKDWTPVFTSMELLEQLEPAPADGSNEAGAINYFSN